LPAHPFGLNEIAMRAWGTAEIKEISSTLAQREVLSTNSPTADHGDIHPLKEQPLSLSCSREDVYHSAHNSLFQNYDS